MRMPAWSKTVLRASRTRARATTDETGANAHVTPSRGDGPVAWPSRPLDLGESESWASPSQPTATGQKKRGGNARAGSPDGIP